jgi:hypothetical protein
MLTDAQLEHVNIMVMHGKGLRDALRLCCGVELTEKLRDWFLAHPTAQAQYLQAKQK